MPANGVRLVYWYRIVSYNTNCSTYYGSVRVNSTTIKRYALCETRQTPGYVRDSIDLSPYSGQVVAIRFRATTPSPNYTTFYIDDVVLQTITLMEPGDEAPDQAEVAPEPGLEEPAPDEIAITPEPQPPAPDEAQGTPEPEMPAPPP